MDELFTDMPGTLVSKQSSAVAKSAKTKAAHGAALLGTSVAGGVIANQLPQNSKGQKQWKQGYASAKKLKISKQSSAVAKAKKRRGEVYESAKAGGAIGAMAGGGLGTASGLGLIASGAAEPMIRQNPSKAGRALTRTLVPLNSGVRGAARWGVAGVGLGAAAGVYGKHKRKKQQVSKGWGGDATRRAANVSRKAKMARNMEDYRYKRDYKRDIARQDFEDRSFGKVRNFVERFDYDNATRTRRLAAPGLKTSPPRGRSLTRSDKSYAGLPGGGNASFTGQGVGNKGGTLVDYQFTGNKRVRKAFMKPMAPMKPQAVLKPKPLKIAKPKAALKPKRPVS